MPVTGYPPPISGASASALALGSRYSVITQYPTSTQAVAIVPNLPAAPTRAPILAVPAVPLEKRAAPISGVEPRPRMPIPCGQIGVVRGTHTARVSLPRPIGFPISDAVAALCFDLAAPGNDKTSPDSSPVPVFCAPASQLNITADPSPNSNQIDRLIVPDCPATPTWVPYPSRTATHAVAKTPATGNGPVYDPNISWNPRIDWGIILAGWPPYNVDDPVFDVWEWLRKAIAEKVAELEREGKLEKPVGLWRVCYSEGDKGEDHVPDKKGMDVQCFDLKGSDEDGKPAVMLI